MIDIKVLRKNLAEVKNQIIVRYHDDKQIIKVTNDLDKVIEFDTMLRKLKTSNQTLEQEKNQVSKAIRVYISKNQLEQLKLAKSNSIKLKKIIESNNNKINESHTKLTEIL